MAKSSKTPTGVTPDDSSTKDEQNSGGATASADSSARKSAKTTRKRRPAPPRKTAGGARSKKTAAQKTDAPIEFTISDEDIRLRAYFIAQHRALSGLSGDSAGDWLEARRQLFDEASKSA